MLYKNRALGSTRNIDRLQIHPPKTDGCRRVTRGGPSAHLPSILQWSRCTAVLTLFDPTPPPPPVVVGKARYSPCHGGFYFPQGRPGIVWVVPPRRIQAVAGSESRCCASTVPNLHPSLLRYHLHSLRLGTRPLNLIYARRSVLMLGRGLVG